MRSLILLLLIFIFMTTPVRAEEGLFKGWSEVGDGAQRLWDESKTFVTTPIGLDNYGLLATLATAAAVGATYSIDNDIRSKIAEHKGDRLDKAAEAGSVIGDPFLHLGIAGAVYGGGIIAGSAKYKELGEMLGESVILADISTFFLKEAIGRERPFHGNDKGSFSPFQFKSDFDSLPSMHTASSFAMASVLAATSEQFLVKLGYYATAAFVGYSRLYQDKHWASDIVLGAAIGELSGRVVTSYHAGKGRRITIAPTASSTGGGLLLVGRW